MLQVQVTEKIQIIGHVVAVLRDAKTGAFKSRHESKNIVTTDGDLFYAERGVAATPTNFTDGSSVFDGIMELYNGASAAPAQGNDRSDMAGLVSGSAKAMASGYPKLNDLDADNTGKGVDVITYKASYGSSEANATGIDDVVITNPSPGASEPLLNHADGLSFAKTAADTLDVWVNHTFNGV